MTSRLVCHTSLPHNNKKMTTSEQVELLGNNWERHFDKQHKRHYFFNTRTGQSIWQAPNNKALSTIKCLFYQESATQQQQQVIPVQVSYNANMPLDALLAEVVKKASGKNTVAAAQDYALILITPPQSKCGAWLYNKDAENVKLLGELNLTQQVQKKIIKFNF